MGTAVWSDFRQSAANSTRDLMTYEMLGECFDSTSFLCLLSLRAEGVKKPQPPQSPGKEQAAEGQLGFPWAKIKWQAGSHIHSETFSYGSGRGGQLLEICGRKLGVSDVRAQWEVIGSPLSTGQGCLILLLLLRTEAVKV